MGVRFRLNGFVMLRTVLIIVGIVIALAVLVTAGVIEGIRTNRWGVTEDLQTASARLKDVPRVVGPWTGTDLWIEPKILERAEATGSLSRVYQNNKTGTAVSALLLCGPSGPIGAHTPDICYGGLGYKMMGREVRKTITLADGTVSAYWSCQFTKPDSPGDLGLEVVWAWGVDGGWVAADEPRREFISHNALHKLYVTRGLTPADRDDRVPPDPIREFLMEFLPEVKKAIAPGPG